LTDENQYRFIRKSRLFFVSYYLKSAAATCSFIREWIAVAGYGASEAETSRKRQSRRGTQYFSPPEVPCRGNVPERWPPEMPPKKTKQAESPREEGPSNCFPLKTRSSAASMVARSAGRAPPGSSSRRPAGAQSKITPVVEERAPAVLIPIPKRKSLYRCIDRRNRKTKVEK